MAISPVSSPIAVKALQRAAAPAPSAPTAPAKPKPKVCVATGPYWGLDNYILGTGTLGIIGGVVAGIIGLGPIGVGLAAVGLAGLGLGGMLAWDHHVIHCS